MARSQFWIALCASLLALGCGDHTPATSCGGRDADAGRADAAAGDVANGDAVDASDPDTAADGGDGGDGGGTGLPPLVPPTVDCAPYAGLKSCAIRVAPGGKASGDGLTWATAFADVQDALDRATCGCQVWIAAGTYLPTRGADPTDPDPRANSFLLWSGIQAIGGFAGTEDSPMARTDGHETILSGELGDPDTRDDNAYHVVRSGDGTYLERVTVSGGHANGFNVGQGVGAGVFVAGGAIKLWEDSITDNDADSGGGVWADAPSELIIFGGTIARNVADVGGGVGTSAFSTDIQGTRFFENVGVFVGGAVASSSASLRVRSASFTRNRGDFGASIALSAGTGTIDQSRFEGNVAGLFGGALFLRLGARGFLTNSVVVANSSVGHGGALTVWTASLDVNLCTIVDNSAAFGGAMVIKDGAHFTLKNTLLWRNSDDAGKTFFLEGADNVVSIATSDLPIDELPVEIPQTATFDKDPLLVNVPLATRFAESLGLAADQMTLAQADKHFAVGDRIELGDDGLERHVTAVTTVAITFTPAWTTATPRWLRVDHWAVGAPSLTLDPTPTAASPLIDAAGPGVQSIDVSGNARYDVPGVGVECAADAGFCSAPDIGAIELPRK